MKKATINEGNAACVHKWVRRDKANISLLTRACTECGAVEIHSENDNIDSTTAKKIMRLD